MGSLQFYENNTTNPLDLIERLAERRDWSVDRTNDCEVTMVMGGGWSDLYVSLNWRDDLESLLVACTYDIKVPPARKDEVGRLLLWSTNVVHGHFDMARRQHVFRNNLVLAGGAVITQCEASSPRIRSRDAITPPCGMSAGRASDAALESNLLETMGEDIDAQGNLVLWAPARWAAPCWRAGLNPAPIPAKSWSLIPMLPTS
jgi:hypothetical protein